MLLFWIIYPKNLLSNHHRHTEYNQSNIIESFQSPHVQASRDPGFLFRLSQQEKETLLISYEGIICHKTTFLSCE